MGGRNRAVKLKDISAPDDVDELKEALREAQEELEKAEARKARAVARGTATLRRENEMLEAQLTRLVQEIGQLRFVADRVSVLERDLRAKDLSLAEVETERDRLQAALDSGRPTARAAAAASRAAKLFGGSRAS